MAVAADSGAVYAGCARSTATASNIDVSWADVTSASPSVGSVTPDPGALDPPAARSARISGNGLLGAMIRGGTREGHIQRNEATL